MCVGKGGSQKTSINRQKIDDYLNYLFIYLVCLSIFNYLFLIFNLF